MRLDFGGQGQMKCCAPPGVGRGPQPATLRLNGTADCEAYAGVLWFGRLTEEMLSN